MQKLDVKLHPIASVFPPMTEEEFEQLKADIEAHGQRESIVYWNQMLIDGRHRLRACQELGIEPMEVELEPNDDPVAFALSCNLHRRHLTTSQRSMVAAKLATLKKHAHKSDTSNDVSQDEAAKMLNVSTPSVQRAKQVIEHGSKDVIEAVETGEIPVSLAAKLVTEQPDKREQSELAAKGAKVVRETLRGLSETSVAAETERVEWEDAEEDEPQQDSKLEEFKRFWRGCSDISRAAIRIWVNDQEIMR